MKALSTYITENSAQVSNSSWGIKGIKNILAKIKNKYFGGQEILQNTIILSTAQEDLKYIPKSFSKYIDKKYAKLTVNQLDELDALYTDFVNKNNLATYKYKNWSDGIALDLNELDKKRISELYDEVKNIFVSWCKKNDIQHKPETKLPVDGKCEYAIMDFDEYYFYPHVAVYWETVD